MDNAISPSYKNLMSIWEVQYLIGIVIADHICDEWKMEITDNESLSIVETRMRVLVYECKNLNGTGRGIPNFLTKVSLRLTIWQPLNTLF